MGTITKKKIITDISKRLGLHPNEARPVVQAFLDCLIDCLSKEDRIELRGFGIFEVVKRKQKIGRNPKNASVPIVIPERKAVKFVPGKIMKEEVAKEQNIENVPQQKVVF